MQNRREFLVKSVGGTAAVAAISLLDTACAPPPDPITTGYAVGQQPPPIVGPNQYGGTSSSAHHHGSWVLVDLCPWWCQPCLSSAIHHADFVGAVRSAGVDLRVVAVVVEKLNFTPSTRFDAEQWSGRFGLDSEVVLHCDGDTGSPLRQLSSAFGTANGNPDGGYPTYALIDPGGILRHYQASSDLNALQAAIAQHTGAGLNGTWAVGGLVNPSPPLATVGNVLAAGTVLGGAAFEDSFAYGAQGPHIMVGDTNLAEFAPSLATFGSAALSLTGPLDPDTATSFTFTAAAPPHGQRYVRLADVDADIVIVPDDAWSETGLDESKLIHTQAVVTSDTDRTTVTVAPTAPLLGPERTCSAVVFRRLVGAMHWSMPYSLAEQLAADVVTRVADPGAASAISGDLAFVRSALAARNFTEAALVARSVGNQAVDANAAFPFIDDAQLLVELVEAAAAGL